MADSRSSKTKTTKRTSSTGVSKVSSVQLTPPFEPVGTALPTSRIRKSLPKTCHSIQRRKAAIALALRAEGLDDTEIAKQIGYKNAHSVHQLLYDAGKRGWVITPDIDAHLTYVTSHKIIRNVDKQLDGADLTELQHKMTIAAARGRGLFRIHDADKQQGPATSMVLGVKIEVVQPNGQPTRIPDGAMGGTPRYLEGQVGEA